MFLLLRLLLLTLSFLFLITSLPAQDPDSLQKNLTALKKDIEALKRFRFSGYIQPQFQMADSAGQSSFNGGNFAAGLNNRFMVRRGRFKVQYTAAENKKGIATSTCVIQIDVTERGTGIKDAYVRLTDPLTGWVSVTTGVFDNPFGYEIKYSSSQRESPERGRMSQLHFPNEREVGAMLSIQAPKSSPWNKYRLDAGLFNGNSTPSFGVDVSDFDSKKDLSSRLSTEQSFANDKHTFGAGLSYYNGGFRIDSVNVYTMADDADGISAFVLDSKASENGTIPIADRRFTKREYFGVDARYSILWKAGKTTLRAEFIQGDQPGLSTSAKSPNDKNPVSKDIFQRSFNGAYFYLVHRLPKKPLEFVLKYDFYDPNTSVSGDAIGRVPAGSTRATNETDLRYDTFGAGVLWYYDANIRIMFYFDKVSNETSRNLVNFGSDRPDDVFTVRMQMRF